MVEKKFISDSENKISTNFYLNGDFCISKIGLCEIVRLGFVSFLFFFFHHSDIFIHWRLIYRVFQKEDCKLLISTFFTTLSIKARIFVAIYFLWQRLNIFFSPVLLWTAPISNMEFLSRLFRSNIKFDGIIDLKNV